MTKRKKRKKPQNPPRDVLERMATERLTPVGEGGVKIFGSDVERAVARLREALPEFFEEEESSDREE